VHRFRTLPLLQLLAGADLAVWRGGAAWRACLKPKCRIGGGIEVLGVVHPIADCFAGRERGRAGTRSCLGIAIVIPRGM